MYLRVVDALLLHSLQPHQFLAAGGIPTLLHLLHQYAAVQRRLPWHAPAGAPPLPSPELRGGGQALASSTIHPAHKCAREALSALSELTGIQAKTGIQLFGEGKVRLAQQGGEMAGEW